MHDGKLISTEKEAEEYLKVNGIEATHTYNVSGKQFIIRPKFGIEYKKNNETEAQRIRRWQILKDRG